MSDDEKLADLLREATGGLFEENYDGEQKILGYKIFVFSIITIALVTYYQIIALAVVGASILVGLVNSSFPIFMFAFLCGLAGSIFRVIYDQVRHE